MWSAKYKPKNLREFVNHIESVEKFLKWTRRWKPGNKAMLFYGMPGTGKTSLVQAYSNENKLELIEMNASDWRSASKIQEVLGQSMKQSPLFKKSKIFLIDECDGLAGREDFGGVGAIIKIIRESKFPVVLIANNPFDSKLRTLRTYCELVEFKKITAWDIEKRLKEICDREDVKCDKEVLRQLAKMSGGDLRSAINDMEIVCMGKKEISLKDLESLGDRERETNIFEALKFIFKTRSVLAAKLSIKNVDKDPEEIFWWIENNIANEYEDPEEIAKAFDALSMADVFRQIVSLKQNWRFRGYMIDMMTAGVSQAKKDVYRKFTGYKYPTNMIVLGRTKIKRKDEGEELLEISKQVHCSTRKIRKEFLPFLRLLRPRDGKITPFQGHPERVQRDV